VTGITLGIARQRGFNRQNGRNQAFNHAGNVAGAALSGFLGWTFGFVAIFWLAAAFGLLSIASVLMVPREVIDVTPRGVWAKTRAREKPKAGGCCWSASRFWCSPRAWAFSTSAMAPCCRSMGSPW